MRALLLLLGALAACGYPPLDDNGSPDGGNPGTCPAPMTYGTASMTAQDSFYYPPTQQDPELLSYIGKLNATDFLDVELVETPGTQFDQGVKPATITLSGGETNSATCSGCVLVWAKCTACALGADYKGQSYMVTGGTLSITAINPSITGTLSNATFVHVTIDAASSTSTPVGDGCTTKVASASFTAHVRQ